MTVKKNDFGKDVFSLLTNPPVDIDITTTEGSIQLKTMFSTLLEELSKDDVEIVFVKTEGYSVAIYEDVCREYIDVLCQELKQTRDQLIAEDLCEQ